MAFDTSFQRSLNAHLKNEIDQLKESCIKSLETNHPKFYKLYKDNKLELNVSIKQSNFSIKYYAIIITIKNTENKDEINIYYKVYDTSFPANCGTSILSSIICEFIDCKYHHNIKETPTHYQFMLDDCLFLEIGFMSLTNILSKFFYYLQKSNIFMTNVIYITADYQKTLENCILPNIGFTKIYNFINKNSGKLNTFWKLSPAQESK